MRNSCPLFPSSVWYGSQNWSRQNWSRCSRNGDFALSHRNSIADDKFFSFAVQQWNRRSFMGILTWKSRFQACYIEIVSLSVLHTTYFWTWPCLFRLHNTLDLYDWCYSLSPNNYYNNESCHQYWGRVNSKNLISRGMSISQWILSANMTETNVEPRMEFISQTTTQASIKFILW